MRYCIINREDIESNKIAEEIKKKCNHTYDDKNPDIVAAIGGDGTILRAAHLYPNAILFGMHTGHLGFYANYYQEELELFIEQMNHGGYKIEKLRMLTGKILLTSNEELEINALNEITIVTPSRTLILNVCIDDVFLEKFRGTGMCISTPSGSTAYNKSLHGSVIDPELNCLQLTEIAGINSNSYRTLSSPLVLSHKKVIQFEATKPEDVYITVDNLSYSIQDFKSMKVYYNEKYIQMAYHSPSGFLDRIHRTFLISKD